jgi:hypothetical protein
MKKFSVLILLIVGLCMVPALVHADPITVGDPLWYEFLFGVAPSLGSNGTGAVASSGGNSQYAPDNPWTFTLASGSRVTITDAFAAGDIFTLYDFGVPQGSTTFVLAGGPVTGISDPVVALGNLDLSHGFFSLGPGAHSLEIQVVQNATSSPSGGAAYFRVDECTPVPIPPSVLLFGTSLLGLAGLRLRRRHLA